MGDGLLLSTGRRRAARIVGVVGGIGALLVGTIVALFGLVLVFAPVDDRAIGAGRVLDFHRKRYPLDPDWRHLGASAASAMVALYGVAALVPGDPDLARALGFGHAAPAESRGDGDGESSYERDHSGEVGGDD